MPFHHHRAHRHHSEALRPPPGGRGEVTHKSQQCSLPFPHKCPEPALDLNFLSASFILCCFSLVSAPPSREAACSKGLQTALFQSLPLLLRSLCGLDFLKALRSHEHAGAALTALALLSPASCKLESPTQDPGLSPLLSTLDGLLPLASRPMAARHPV